MIWVILAVAWTLASILTGLVVGRATAQNNRPDRRERRR
jgi:hypothetical protein